MQTVRRKRPRSVPPSERLLPVHRLHVAALRTGAPPSALALSLCSACQLLPLSTPRASVGPGTMPEPSCGPQLLTCPLPLAPFAQCEATSSDVGAYIDASGACRACPSGCTSCRDGDGSCDSEQVQPGSSKSDEEDQPNKGGTDEEDGEDGSARSCPEHCSVCNRRGKCRECEEGWILDETRACVQVRGSQCKGVTHCLAGPSAWHALLSDSVGLAVWDTACLALLMRLHESAQWHEQRPNGPPQPITSARSAATTAYGASPAPPAAPSAPSVPLDTRRCAAAARAAPAQPAPAAQMGRLSAQSAGTALWPLAAAAPSAPSAAACGATQLTPAAAWSAVGRRVRTHPANASR